MADLIIFDCDGVLVDSEVIYVEAEREMLARAGLVISRERYLLSFTGLPQKAWQEKISAELLDETGQNTDNAFFAEISDHCARAFEAELEAVPGSAEMLHAHNGPVCVASSSLTEELHWKLRHTGLHDLFDPHIFSTERVTHGKPAPDLFLHAADQMNIAPARAIVVEDSVNGVKAGKAAGMAVIGFTGGRHCFAGHSDLLTDHGADLIVDAFAKLPAGIAHLDEAVSTSH